jgi:two-component system sensor histidine kinase BaeS
MGRGERRQRGAPGVAERSDEVGELASAFNEMAEAIEHQEDWRRSMTADLAHELRTPLATIQARIEALQDGVLPANRENLAVIGEEVERLGRLLKGLRSLDDMDAADFSLERQQLRLDEVAADAVEAASERFAQKKVQLTLESQPVGVLGDSDRLRQVTDNLLDNALKFTPGGGHVEVRVTLREASSTVELSVADDGEGISSDDLPHVFER